MTGIPEQPSLALPTPESAPPSPGAASTPVIVDVAGKVRHPGVVTLPPGSRLGEAITAAGGALPSTDLSGLNLARVLSDGEQVPVAVSGAPPAPGVAPGAGPGALSAAPAGPLDLNAATGEQLDQLPGVGPVLAQAITDWKAQHGRFTSVDQLREVRGIGPRKFAELRAKVRV